MRKTAYLYILKETLPIFFIGLLTFTLMLLMDKIFKFIELIVSGVSFSHILMLLFFISPSFLIFTIPMAFLLGTLLSFGRLSGDSEITAFKASGISLYQLFIPISLLSLIAYLFTTFLVFYALPWGNRGFMATLYVIAQSKVDIDMKERVFNDVFNALVVYVDKIPIQGGKMEGVLIYDERDKGNVNTIFAREGFLASNPQSKEVTLRLLNGDIHRFESKTRVYQKMKFDIYDLRLELGKTFAAWGARLKEHEMSFDELNEKIRKMKISGQDTTFQEVELHRRYAIPFACIVFGLIGVPLGIQPRRSARAYGFILTIFIIMGYYMCLTTSGMLAIRKMIPPLLAGWMPNLLFSSLGVYLLVKAANESPFKPLVWLTEGIDFFQRKWKGLFEEDV